ncbi:MAG: DALR anticodon-binding domain-containing protein [Candidatus Pacebacteria bacterium]|nr:DALR anticodon-binding domain-containing protein [Candidatus Paceibacterota bacterium]
MLDEAAKQAEEQLIARSKAFAEKAAEKEAEKKEDEKKEAEKKPAEKKEALPAPAPIVLNEADLKESAEKIGMAAIKYFDLKQNRVSNYEFSYERMLDARGDTALYLLYAYARLDSILRKAGIDSAKLQELITKGKVKITHDKERALVFEILRFPETLDDFVQDLYLNRLCSLVYDISVKVGEFYESCKVIGSAEQDSRILFIAASLMMMKCILNLLGIEPLHKI